MRHDALSLGCDVVVSFDLGCFLLYLFVVFLFFFFMQSALDVLLQFSDARHDPRWHALAFLEVPVEHDYPTSWRENEKQPDPCCPPCLKEAIAERFGDRRPKVATVFLQDFQQGLGFLCCVGI